MLVSTFIFVYNFLEAAEKFAEVGSKDSRLQFEV